MPLHTAESSSLGVSFAGALQASVSVLLTLSFGFFAARYKMIRSKTQKEISGLCVNLFMPALLIVTVGKEIGRPENADEKSMYGGFILWSLFYTLLGVGFGLAAQKLLKLPSWTAPAVAFNNTTSLPLLLVQSLETTGFLDSLITHGDSRDAVRRAQAFFLVNAMVNKSLILGLGPKLLFGFGNKQQNEDNSSNGRRRRRNSTRSLRSEDGARSDSEADESTSLLPEPVQNHVATAQEYAQSGFDALPQPAQKTLDFATEAINPALAGAFVALIIGLNPPLHKAFFAKGPNGGIFTGWLTSAAENIGELFSALQMFVVGANLSVAAEEAVVKRRQSNSSSQNGSQSGANGDVENGGSQGNQNGNNDDSKEGFSWIAVLVIFFFRFVVWTVLSCSLVYLLASKLRWLSRDPIVWFAMTLMPIGPTAMILVPLIDISKNKGKKDPKTEVSKVLAIMYALTPIICIPVVAALKLSEKMMREMDL